MLLIGLSLPGSRAWADAATDRSDRLCEKAAHSERDATEAERKSEERRRFLKGKGGIVSRNDASAGDTAAIRQSVKAQIAQARAILPQLRQGAAAAGQDRGIVPGLSQYFTRMESDLGRALQAAEACLDSPRYCSVPSISCPPPPGMPAVHNASADLVRQVQQSYAQAANTARQACLTMNAGVLGGVERLKRESRGAGAMAGGEGSDRSQRFGETDLHLRRAESVRREASQYRREADRISGVAGYCATRSRVHIGAETTHALVEAFKARGKREGRTETGLSIDATVIDLKAGWERKWNKGTTLEASGVPLPKLTAGDGGETDLDRTGYTPEEDGPSWWDETKSAYRKADEEMELTEFIRSRPKQMTKFLAKEVVKLRLGAFGESLVNAYTILDAVKTTSDEVGKILVDAPGVIAHGSVAEARELYARTERVPLNLLNNLFDDVTDWLPAPRRGSKEGAGR